MQVRRRCVIAIRIELEMVVFGRTKCGLIAARCLLGESSRRVSSHGAGRLVIGSGRELTGHAGRFPCSIAAETR